MKSGSTRKRLPRRKNPASGTGCAVLRRAQRFSPNIENIAEAPERWPVFGSSVRRYLLRRFPFSVIYRVREDVIEVLAVAHHRRKPGYWAGRRL